MNSDAQPKPDAAKPDTSPYDPDNLLDALLAKLSLKNDAALSRALEVAPPVISKIRHRRLPVGPSMLIRMHEVSDLSIRELRTLMGDRRQITRFSNKTGLANQPDAAERAERNDSMNSDKE